MEEFIIYVEDNKEVALSVFEKYYSDKAIEEGEVMLCDETFCEDNELEPDDLYELDSMIQEIEFEYLDK